MSVMAPMAVRKPDALRRKLHDVLHIDAAVTALLVRRSSDTIAVAQRLEHVVLKIHHQSMSQSVGTDGMREVRPQRILHTDADRGYISRTQMRHSAEVRFQHPMVTTV